MSINSPSHTQQSSSIIDFDAPKIKRYNHLRKVKNQVATVGISLGGISVIAAILLIFLYLMYEVVPMFAAADVEEINQYALVGDASETLYLAIEEQNELALRVAQSGQLSFINLEDGSVNTELQLPLPTGAEISSFAINSEESRLMAVGLSNGQVLLFKHNYRISYPDDGRVIAPRIDYPFGEEPLKLLDDGQAIEALAVRDEEEQLQIVVRNAGRLQGVTFIKEEDFLSEEMVLVPEAMSLPTLDDDTDAALTLGQLLIDIDQRFLFVQVSDKQLAVIDINQGHVQRIDLNGDIRAIEFLLGGLSLLIADETGDIGQWFMVRDALGQHQLTLIRTFTGDYPGEALTISSEQRRKGFVTASGDGQLGIYHSTAHRTVFQQALLDGQTQRMALSPRANRLLVLNTDNELQLLKIENEHPEVSWQSLWGEVWYESYQEPEYIWQSSSSSNDFEAKMSLMPLSFGTLKAAFYAMLLGAPLAICGAIYTAYFMTPMMRRKIKPLIELMEALPTVILGFLAGLWLAPFLEKNLVGVFSLFILLPPLVVLFAFAMSKLPQGIQNIVAEGWHGFILIPVLILIAAFCLGVSPMLEVMFFEGDMRQWLTHDLGISFDQRNAMVVGIAMGFAVIPTIFSIAEDAIFSVPKHLSYGSLALGATPWQTLVGVVLPTASPGIFSGLMIGLGRAVGETMIVLMATGNTPIMDANIFEGMRTLSANIAVEVPEAEVDSTHYRILFLAAFVLFSFTFVVNTIAEVVRQRLRKKYGSL